MAKSKPINWPARWRVRPTHWWGNEPKPIAMKIEAKDSDDAFWKVRARYAELGCAVIDADIEIVRRS